MARRRRAQRRHIAPDPLYGSVELTRFINRLMIGGKKSVAQKAMYDALAKLEIETDGSITPGEAFHKATSILKHHFEKIHEADALTPKDAPKKTKKKDK